MAEKAAKAKLLTSESKLKTSIKDLGDKCAGDNGVSPTEQVLSRSLATLKADWNAYENHHNSYVEVQTLDNLVEFFERFNAVYAQYQAVVERGNALISSRQPPLPVQAAPRQASMQEQYDLAALERENSFDEAREIVKWVADYLKEKREETPTSLQHVRDELAKAETLIKVGEVFAGTMGTLMPEHAVRDRTADSLKVREIKGLIREQVNILGLLTVAAAPPVPPSPTTTVQRDWSFMYERRSLPSFAGARRDYPSFRREWQTNVSGKVSVEYELREIKQKTPAEVEPDLKNLKSLKDVWEFLDRKYGNTMELASELIHGLHNFQYSVKAKTESAKFAELDREWTKVYNDLEEVEKLDSLDHEPTLTGLSRKLPTTEAKKAYCDLRIKMIEECEQATPPTKVSELEVMKLFMKAERRRQETYAGVLNDAAVASKPREWIPGQNGAREVTCFRCGKIGHRQAECRGQGGGRGSANHASQQAGASVPCPACEQYHTFQGRDGVVRPSTRLGCPAFKQLTINERVSMLEDSNGCARCMDFTGRHQRDSCPYRGQDGQLWTCNAEVNGVRCGKEHHQSLHGTNNKFAMYTQVNRVHVSRAPTDEEINASLKGTTLLQLQDVPVEGSNIMCMTFFDTGSTVHLVRRGYAQKLGLKGRRTMLELTTTGERKESRETTVYWVPLLDRTGVTHTVMAYEMENITAPMEAEDVSVAEKLFPMVKKGSLKRPSGPVDLLVGIHMAGIFPSLANREKHLKGNLRLMTSIFGTGWVLDGDHAEIKANVMLESPEARELTRRGAVNHVKLSSPLNVIQKSVEEEVKQVSECEGFSQARCFSTAVALTRWEEPNMIEENVELDLEKQEVRFQYPMIKDPRLPVNDLCAVEANARRLETRLTKQRGIEAYNQEMKAFVERCTSAELSKEEMELWARRGQPVVNEKSAMTQVQIVDKSRLTVDWLYQCCTMWDLAKANNTVKTFDEEMHLRRLVWRWSEGDQQGFASLLPYNKDNRRNKNLKEDGVCLFQYENKVKITLCRGKEVKESEDRLSRTSTIVYKARSRVSFPRATMDVAIQRLVLSEKVTGEDEEVERMKPGAEVKDWSMRLDILANLRRANCVPFEAV